MRVALVALTQLELDIQSGVSLQYDPVNPIVYSQNKEGGFWRLSTQ